MTPKQVARFWSKVEIRGPRDCWLWKGATCANRSGDLYGNFDRMGAHRFSYQLANPGETLKVVRHSCDTPLCVNPAHLFNGTQDENLKDMVQKGRSCRGKDNNHARLTEQDVRDIAVWYATGKVSVREIADKYGMEKYAIQRVVNGKGWKHVEREDTSAVLKTQHQRAGEKRRGEDGTRAKLTEEQVREIHAAWAKGDVSRTDLAAKYEVSESTVQRIVKGKIWSHLGLASSEDGRARRFRQARQPAA